VDWDIGEVSFRPWYYNAFLLTKHTGEQSQASNVMLRENLQRRVTPGCIDVHGVENCDH
jgi:hypothetical protein